MITRKGITQHFSADGFVQGDERWQVARFANGVVRLDAEVTRIAPFPEPRQESFSLTCSTVRACPNKLGEPPGPLFRALVPGQREARMSVVDNRAMFCWQHGHETHRAEKAWGDENEIDYNSPLFMTALIWQSALAPGQTRAYTRAQLDALTFEPHFALQTLARLEDEDHETRFGIMRLAHYVQTPATSQPHPQKESAHFWCDEDGIVFDLISHNGARQVLTAVSFPE